MNDCLAAVTEAAPPRILGLATSLGALRQQELGEAARAIRNLSVTTGRVQADVETVDLQAAEQHGRLCVAGLTSPRVVHRSSLQELQGAADVLNIEGARTKW